MHSNFGSLDGSIYDTVYVARVSQMPRATEALSDLYDAGQTRNVSPENLEGGIPARLQAPILKPAPDNDR
nr:hypothetical protein [uncultured Roseateles sp.]